MEAKLRFIPKTEIYVHLASCDLSEPVRSARTPKWERSTEADVVMHLAYVCEAKLSKSVCGIGKILKWRAVQCRDRIAPVATTPITSPFQSFR